MWALMDSGAAPNIADLAKHFPGAKLVPSDASKRGQQYANANGTLFSGNGQFSIECTTAEGHRREFTFQNAQVAMPILSTGQIADQGNVIYYDQYGGHIINLTSGEQSRFIRRQGVYFIELRVNSDLVPDNHDQGFQRRG